MPHTIVLTGAGSGIGQLLAERLTERGDCLVLVARDADRADDLAAEHPGAAMIVAELARPESLAAAVAASDLPDGIDAVVHAFHKVRSASSSLYSVAMSRQ